MGNDEMNDRTLYWLALRYVVGTASPKIKSVMENGVEPAALFKDRRERLLCGFFSDRELERFDSAPEKAETALVRANKLGQSVICPEDTEYPERLRGIYAPPAVLFYRGVLPAFDEEVAIAMVGTRNATEYGRTVAVELSMCLAKAGAVIVSGAAKGVDSYSHTGALQVFGRTAAVLGCAIDYPYLMENKPMRDMIEKHGVLISEYSPGSPASKWSFPERNRIISGLSLGTVVIEAGEKSGSLITAGYAAEQGRELFAVPGSVMSPSFAGTNRLLREGAKPVFGAMDVLEEFAGAFPQKLNLSGVSDSMSGTASYISEHSERTRDKKPSGKNTASDAAKPAFEEKSVKTVQKKNTEGLSRDAVLVYNTFGTSANECAFDELVSLTGLPAHTLMRTLTLLECKGYIELAPGNKYRLI